MLKHNLEQSNSIQCSIAILKQALDKLEVHDYASAQIMVGVANQILSDVQLQLDHQLNLRQSLNQLVKQ